ncbi:MAG TPA: hypothetical protein VFK02_30530 [Kofleriaceae bacterium]|nr:hypothetical protein [Kofleriaceae bacterium]
MDIQTHILSRTLPLPSRAKTLWLELRNELIRAHEAGSLQTSHEEILQRVRLLPEPPPNIAEELRAHGLERHAYCVVGGEKNQDRNAALPHLMREDGAWFDFSITVREREGELDLLAQDFEIRFPPGMGTPFLRYDVNWPWHRNKERELRSHLHAGSDDILIPAPLMSPRELLSLFLDGLRLPANRPARRARSQFEIEWFRDTHAIAVG